MGYGFVGYRKEISDQGIGTEASASVDGLDTDSLCNVATSELQLRDWTPAVCPEGPPPYSSPKGSAPLSFH